MNDDGLYKTTEGGSPRSTRNVYKKVMTAAVEEPAGLTKDP